MKTSNKILLALIIVGFGIFASVHLTLYAKYKKGDIVTGNMIAKQWFTRYTLPAPTHLFITGFENVDIIPSDSFYFEIQKKSNGMAGYKIIHDSIYIIGDTSEITTVNNQVIVPLTGVREMLKSEIRISAKHLSGQYLNLHCPAIGKISIEDGYIFLRGSTDPAKVDLDLDIYNTNFNLSNRNIYDTAKYLNRFYHNITLHARKSFIFLNKNSEIKNFTVLPDNETELVDNHATIENFLINPADKSTIHLSGQNLKKVKPIQ